MAEKLIFEEAVWLKEFGGKNFIQNWINELRDYRRHSETNEDICEANYCEENESNINVKKRQQCRESNVKTMFLFDV